MLINPKENSASTILLYVMLNEVKHLDPFFHSSVVPLRGRKSDMLKITSEKGTNAMEKSKLVEIIRSNPNALAYIQNPPEEIKLLAVQKNGLALRHIEKPSREMQEVALANNSSAIQYIDQPTEKMMTKAIKDSWVNLEYIKNPSANLIKLALQQAGWAIKYVKNPSEELQLLAVQKNYDSIKFIKTPSPTAQEEAVRISYDALRYIDSPTSQAERLAVKSHESAVTFVKDLSKPKILEFLKVNISVIKYVLKDITKAELEQVLKEILAQEDVDEKYVRDFLNCSTIYKNSKQMPLDKLALIYQYGSKKAKKVAVDEKLKL